MTVQNHTRNNRGRPLSEYEQKYLDCLEERRPELEELLYRVGFCWADAMEAAQDAIIEALKLIEARAVETLKDRRAWLRVKAIRKARSNRSRWRKCVWLDPNTPAPEPFAVEEDDDRYASVRSAFEHLPFHLQELVAFVYLKGHTYTQAAAWFDISLGVVSRRLGQARELLRSELGALPLFRARAKAS